MCCTRWMVRPKDVRAAGMAMRRCSEMKKTKSSANMQPLQMKLFVFLPIDTMHMTVLINYGQLFTFSRKQV